MAKSNEVKDIELSLGIEKNARKDIKKDIDALTKKINKTEGERRKKGLKGETKYLTELKNKRKALRDAGYKYDKRIGRREVRLAGQIEADRLKAIATARRKATQGKWDKRVRGRRNALNRQHESALGMNRTVDKRRASARRKDIQGRWDARLSQREKAKQVYNTAHGLALEMNKKVNEAIRNARRKDVQKRWNARVSSREAMNRQHGQALEMNKRWKPRAVSSGIAGGVAGGIAGGRKWTLGSSSLGKLANVVHSLRYIVLGLSTIIAPFILALDAMKEYMAFAKSNLVVSGSKAQAGKNESYVRGLASTVGASVSVLGKEFTKFSASSPDDMAKSEIKRIFSAVVKHGSIFSANKDDTKLVMKAITQIMSKGKVQAEELRGQLGERSAGAFKLFAKGMGMSIEELDKAMKKGLVLSGDALPKFATQLEGEIAKIGSKDMWDGLTNNLERANTLFETAAGEMGKGGLDRTAGDFAIAWGRIKASFVNAFTPLTPYMTIISEGVMIPIMDSIANFMNFLGDVVHEFNGLIYTMTGGKVDLYKIAYGMQDNQDTPNSGKVEGGFSGVVDRLADTDFIGSIMKGQGMMHVVNNASQGLATVIQNNDFSGTHTQEALEQSVRESTDKISFNLQ